MPSPSVEPTSQKLPLRRSLALGRLRDLFLQGLLLVAVGMVIFYFVRNGITNLRRQGITSGLDFLERTSGFSVIQHLVPYDEKSTYAQAFLVAILNTLLVSVLGIAMATVAGFGLGIARISKHSLTYKLSIVYVELVRNIPLLLQIFFWYFGVLRTLPMPAESWDLGDILFLNIRGLYLPNPFTGEVPHLGPFNIEGGICLLPELAALFLALSTYTAAFVAEIVRAGLLAVGEGQWEAAAALGLTRGETLRLIIMPQAMRVILPPLTSQWLNVTKNSSLGAAIGYPEIALVFAGTVLLQTGQAVEVMALTLSVYLLLSLTVAALSAWYQGKVRKRFDPRPERGLGQRP